MDIKALKRLIALLKEEGLTEITVSDGDERITVRQDRSVAAPGAAPRSDETGVGVKTPAEDGSFVVTAPLVGTFYRRRAPDEAPLLEPGDRVAPGDTLCVIEAMKVMNEIAAERPGVLREVLAQDGAAVEFGQGLLRFDVS